MRVSIESDLGGLAASLNVEADRLPSTIRPVVQKAALNIKKDAQAKISGVAHAPNYPRTITYDTEESGMSVTAEIGPDKDKEIGRGRHRTPGNLGNILEYGTSNNAPYAHLGPALDYEGPSFERYLEAAVAEAIEG